MAALETRILVLGGVRLFQPLNGYQLRRELLSWGIEHWANVRPGSIYSMLATLAKAGFVERHDVVDDGRTVRVYTMTEAGHDELRDLIRQGIEAPRPLHFGPLQATFPFLPLVPRDEAVQYFRQRRANVVRHAEEQGSSIMAETTADLVPPQVLRLLELWREFTSVELSWIDQLIDDVRAGQLRFAGDPPDWEPAADDPGWQMHADRERYNALLGRTPDVPVPRPGESLETFDRP